MLIFSFPKSENDISAQEKIKQILDYVSNVVILPELPEVHVDDSDNFYMDLSSNEILVLNYH